MSFVNAAASGTREQYSNPAFFSTTGSPTWSCLIRWLKVSATKSLKEQNKTNIEKACNYFQLDGQHDDVRNFPGSQIPVYNDDMILIYAAAWAFRITHFVYWYRLIERNIRLWMHSFIYLNPFGVHIHINFEIPNPVSQYFLDLSWV